MRTLRIEDIRENPWTVMKYPLPEFPSRLLLLLAQIAATCCREIASETVEEIEAIHGVTEISPPELRAAVQNWHRAHRKIGEIIGLLSDRFGMEGIDFNLSHNVRKFSAVVWLKRLVWRY
jgi:hypothetical protein